MTLCKMEQQSRSNGAGATSSKQAADNTSRIKPAHVLGLLALNPAPVEKTGVPSSAMPAKIDAMDAWSAKIDAMDTGIPSRASSSASDFSTPSVPDSVEFNETNPEALCGLGLGIDENDKEAPGDAVMNDTESESEGGEISAGAAMAVPMQQLCLQTLVSGGASISTSRMQVLNMRVYDVLLHLLSSPRNRVCRF